MDTLVPRRAAPHVLAAATLAILAVLVLSATPSLAAPSLNAPPHPGARAQDPSVTLLAQARASLTTSRGFGAPPAYGNGSVAANWLELKSAEPTGPSTRYLSAMAYDPVDKYVVLFGGSNGSSTITTFGDTWTFAQGQWTELFPSNSPSARYLSDFVWDAKDGYLLLFGGHYLSGSGSANYNDTWTFLHGQWSNITSSSSKMPSVRWRALMAYDAADQYTLLFGGTDTSGTNIMHDTWKFVGGVWTNLSASVTGSPTGRYRAAMAYDPLYGSVVLFGGCTSTASPCATSDTWTYHNLTWTNLNPAVHPGARIYEGLTYDAAHGVLLMFGGSTNSVNPGGPMADTWTFNGTWTNITAKLKVHPANRAFEAMAFDALDNYTLMFGGENINTVVFQDDTWAYGPAILASASLTSSTLDVGQRTTVNVSAATNFPTNSISYAYPTLPPGCVSANVSALVCQPTQSGNFSIEVNVTTPTRQNASVVLNLSVNPDPAIVSFSVAPATVTSGGSIAFSTVARNGTSPYSYAYSGLPSGCASRNVWNLTCRPSGNLSYHVEVAVTDGVRFVVYANTDVNVNPRPSVLSFRASPATVDVGQWTNFTVTAAGGTAPINYTYANLPGGCRVSNAAAVACHAAAVGAFRPTVTVTDAFGFSANASTNLTIDPAPVILAFVVSPRVIDTGQAVTFYLNATNGTGLLNYSYSQSIGGCVLARSSPASCTPTATGNFTVLGRVSDGVGSVVTATIELTVNPDPSVASFLAAPSVLDAHQNLTLTVSAAGGTSPYSYVYQGLPTGCPPVRVPSFTCAPTRSGSPTITVVVTDHYGRTAQGSALVTINPDPTIASFNATPSPATTGVATVFAVSATGGQAPYAYAYSGLPAGCVSRNSSSLSCVPTETGTFNVTVNVTDALHESVTSVASVVVQAPVHPTSSTVLGLPSTTAYVLLAVIVLAVVGALVGLILLRRRRGPPPAESAPEEPAAEEPAWLESPDDTASR